MKGSAVAPPGPVVTRGPAHRCAERSRQVPAAEALAAGSLLISIAMEESCAMRRRSVIQATLRRKAPRHPRAAVDCCGEVARPGVESVRTPGGAEGLG